MDNKPRVEGTARRAPTADKIDSNIFLELFGIYPKITNDAHIPHIIRNMLTCGMA